MFNAFRIRPHQAFVRVLLDSAAPAGLRTHDHTTFDPTALHQPDFQLFNFELHTGLVLLGAPCALRDWVRFRPRSPG